MGAINGLREKGVNTPEDVSVIGFNDNAVASYFYPKLTTVKQPSYDMGSVAMRILIKILNNKPLEEAEFILSHELVERESCKYKGALIGSFLFNFFTKKVIIICILL